jgi:hypothetical protein
MPLENHSLSTTLYTLSSMSFRRPQFPKHFDSVGPGTEAHPGDWAITATNKNYVSAGILYDGELHHRARLTDFRTLLVASPQFVLELVDLPPKSNWDLDAEHETWILVLDGCARIGPTDASVGEAVFLDADCARIEVRPEGMKGLLAYLGPEPRPSLLYNVDGLGSGSEVRGVSSSPLYQRATAGSPIRSMEARP